MLGIKFGKAKTNTSASNTHVVRLFGNMRPEITDLSYCESVWAGPTSPNHIRNFAGQGLMTGGGANNPALCGSEVSWDLRAIKNLAELEQRIANAHETNRVCVKCAELAKEHLSA